MNQTKRLTNSLRSRYLLLVLVMGAVLLGGILWGQHNLNQTSTENALRLQARNQVQEFSRALQASIFETYLSLNRFLLDPNRQDHQGEVYQQLERAIHGSEQLHQHPWIIAHGQQGNIDVLRTSLQEMRNDLRELIATRLDPMRQYPSLTTANQFMMPNRNRFNNAMALAIRESDQLQQEGEQHAHRAVHLLLETRHLWTQMVSNFRNYLANRMGTFDEASLPVQEDAVDTMYGLLTGQLATLRKMNEAGELGFETSAAVPEMIEAITAWRQAFIEVKAIHQTEHWRADAVLIKARIEPRLAEISTRLSRLDSVIRTAAAEDLDKLEAASQAQSQASAIGGIFGLSLLLAIVLSMDRLVLRPIKLVAEGLKAEAFGKEGLPLPKTSSPEAQALIEAFSEMRSQVRQRQAALSHQATHDSLTGLPNRTLLQHRMEQAIRAARREHKPFAFLIMDLDRFKDINDTLGHPVGDQLLSEIGQRLTNALREVDTIARLGGDEFAILLENSDGIRASAVARKVLDALTAPFQINELRLHIGASIGITVYPEHGTDVPVLLQRADVAMYVAKRNQLGHSVYDPSQDEYSVGRLTLMADLRQALEHDDLDVHYQPKLDMRSGQVTGVEALLRWEHPEYGAIPPEQIISLAEHTGLIGEVTYWILERAARTAANWHRAGRPLNMAVNLSVHNLRDPQFVDRVSDCLHRNGLPPLTLTLEITEHAMMANPAEAIRILTALDAIGVMVAVDDYGTGFSSLAYLKQLPVDELKIDKSFVMRMHQNANDEVIVRSTIDLAHNLGLRVVAEGVENAEIWQRLTELGCDTAQGYHMSRPLPLVQLEDWLEHRPG